MVTDPPELFWRPPTIWRPPEVPGLSIFERIPYDVWTYVFRFYLATEFPERPILPDSLIEPLAHWPLPPSAPIRRICVPRNCCHTSRGARSAQALDCIYVGHYERRGLPALLHVDTYARYYLISFPGYLAHYRFLDPVPWRFKFPNTSSNLFSYTGLCCCPLHKLPELLPKAREIRLTFPSSDERYQRSPSSFIKDILCTYGAPELVYLDLRTDWSCVFDADKTKSLVFAPELRESHALNPTMIAYGPKLRRLRLGAEESFFTFLPSDLYAVLRECPQLEDVELLTVLASGPRGWDPRGEQTIKLNRLARIRFRDCLPQWAALRNILLTSSLLHVNIDIITPHTGMITTELTTWWNETVETADFVLQSCPDSLRQAPDLAASLHFQRDLDERHQQYKTELWPEYMTLCLARSAEVLLDPGSYPSEPYFKFTERSVTTSTKAYLPAFRAKKAPSHPPAWIFQVFWTCALNALDAVSGCHAATGRINELIVSADDLLPNPNNWQALLFTLPAVQRLWVPGIRQLGHGLIHLGLSLGIRDGREIPGEVLKEVHLPDWNPSVGPIPVSTLQGLLNPEREFLSDKVMWYL